MLLSHVLLFRGIVLLLFFVHRLCFCFFLMSFYLSVLGRCDLQPSPSTLPPTYCITINTTTHLLHHHQHYHPLTAHKILLNARTLQHHPTHTYTLLFIISAKKASPCFTPMHPRNISPLLPLALSLTPPLTYSLDITMEMAKIILSFYEFFQQPSRKLCKNIEYSEQIK